MAKAPKPIMIADDGFLPRATKRSLPIALLRAREAMMAHFRPMLTAHDLTEQQWRVLRVLVEHDSIDANEIIQLAFVLGPSLTRILSSLEGRKLINRKQDPTDRRRTLHSLTPKGLEFIKTVAPDSHRIYSMIEKRFGRDRIEALLDMLDELAALND